MVLLTFVHKPARALPTQVDTAATTQADTTPGTQALPTAQGAPVTVRGQTLFYLQERVLSFSPEDRARAVAGRLERLYRDPFAKIDSIAVVEGEGVSDIVAGDLIIMSVTERDARAAGLPRAELAQQYADNISTTLQALTREYSLQSILLGAAYTLLTIAVLALIFFAFAKLFPRIYARLDAWRDTRVPALKIQRFELASSSRLTDMLIWLAKGLRFVLTLLVLFVSVPMVLGFFPWTRGYSAIALRYVTTPLISMGQGFLLYLPNIFYVTVIIVVTYYITKFVKLVFGELTKGTIRIPGFYREWARPTYKIVRFLIIAFTAVAIFPYLPGASSDAFKGISIFLGVLFSLGSTSAIANIIAGVVLTYTRAFEEGDRVKISDTVGDVVDRTLLATYIRTTKNVDITIPNAMVLGSHITNYSTSARTGLVLHPTVTIGYDVPWRDVHELLLGAASETENIEEDPVPFVLQTSLDDFYVSYELNVYTDRPKLMATTYSELHQNIQDKFSKAGVEIMSPHFAAVRDGNKINLPESYIPKGYVAPPFLIAGLEGVVQKP
jgi:small-conductance mechanosensitive channel